MRHILGFSILLLLTQQAMATLVFIPLDKTEIKEALTKFEAGLNAVSACTAKLDNKRSSADVDDESPFATKADLLAKTRSIFGLFKKKILADQRGSALVYYRKLDDLLDTHFQKVYQGETEEVCTTSLYGENGTASHLTLLYNKYLSSLNNGIKDIAKEDCTVYHMWGHGNDIAQMIGEVMVATKEVGLVGQGCYLPPNRSGNIKHVRDQSKGYNGTWMDDFDENYNGGYNPLLSPLNLPENESKREAGTDWEDREDAIVEALFRQRNPSLKPGTEGYDELKDKFKSKVAGKVNGVGFMRLTEHNWAAAQLHAKTVLSQGKCSKVRVKFFCEIEGGMSNVTYKARLNSAKADLGIKDAKGNLITFNRKECGLDANGEPIYNIPLQCMVNSTGYGITLNAASADALVKGSCKDTFRRVQSYDEIKIGTTTQP